MFIRQLDYLVALEQEKHFGRAATACGVSQPALSGAIRSLEDELGVRIVLRGRRFEGFTQEGARILVWARRMLAAWDGLQQEARGPAAPQVGVLNMAATSAALPLLPKLIQASLTALPGVRHQTHTLSAADIQRRLVSHELDIGLTYLDDVDATVFDTLPLFSERYVIVGADPVLFEGCQSMSWRKAATLPLCLFADNPQSRRDLDAAFGGAQDYGMPRIEVDAMTALRAYVQRTGFYGILPHSVLCLDDHEPDAFGSDGGRVRVLNDGAAVWSRPLDRFGLGRLHVLPMEPVKRQRKIGLVMLRQSPRPAVVETALRRCAEVDLQGWVDGLLAMRMANLPTLPVHHRQGQAAVAG